MIVPEHVQRSVDGESHELAAEGGMTLGPRDRGVRADVHVAQHRAVSLRQRVGDDVAAERISERCATVAVGPLSFGTGRAVLAADAYAGGRGRCHE